MPRRSAGAKAVNGHGKLFGLIAQRQVHPGLRLASPFHRLSRFPQTSLAFRALQSDSCRDSGHHRQSTEYAALLTIQWADFFGSPNNFEKPPDS